VSTTFSLTQETAVAANAVAALCLLETAARVEAVAVAVAMASALPRVLATAKELATAMHRSGIRQQTRSGNMACHEAYRVDGSAAARVSRYLLAA
jgi:hypothetical protein